MKLFDRVIVDYLNRFCSATEPIYYIGLGQFDFQLAFGEIKRIQSTLKVEFRIKNQNYLWEDGPCEIPVWNLVGQIPFEFVLIAPEVMELKLESGDAIRFHTNEEPYENFLAEIRASGVMALEIY